MSEPITKRALFQSPDLEVGLFTCTPPAPRWVRNDTAKSHLLAFTQSTVCIERDGLEPVIATPNTAVFYNQGDAYRSRVLAGESERTVYFRLSTSLITDVLSETDPAICDRGEHPFALPSRAVSPADYLVHVAALQSAAEGDNLATEETAMSLLANLAAPENSPCVVSKRRSSERDYVRWTAELIATTFRESIPIHDLAQRVGVSPFYLCRIFRRITGSTIHHYRDTLRIRTALWELLDTRDPISHIAFRAGYCSQSHFTKAFRQHLGVCPARIREDRVAPWHAA